MPPSLKRKKCLLSPSAQEEGYIVGFPHGAGPQVWNYRALGPGGSWEIQCTISFPHFKAEKTEAKEGDFPVGAHTVRDVCARGGGGGCRSSPLRSWGPSQGSVRQTHHPRALCGEHQGAPDLGGDLGGTPAESNPPASYITEAAWESPGREAAELFPLPFCFSFCRGTQRSSGGAVCHQSLAPPLSSEHHLFLPAA